MNKRNFIDWRIIMGYIKTPVKGMNDFLPEDMRLRE